MTAPSDENQRQGSQANAPPPTGTPVPEFVEPDKLLAVAQRFRNTLGIVESRISGHSMRSTLPAGSRIRIRCGDLGWVMSGTVVAFLHGSTLIAHRVVGRGRGPRARGFLLTRGDATIFCDAPVHADTVLGVVTHVATADEWQALPRVNHGLVARITRGAVFGIMTMAMELDTRAARSIAVTCLQVRSTARRFMSRVGRLLGVP